MVTQKNQSGRSMVEILGVLAIIGVLSVGSIMGYRNAINKKVANDIVHDVLLESLYVAPQLKEHNELELGNETLTTGYGLETGYIEENSKDTYNFYIIVQGVHSDVCREIAHMVILGTYDVGVVASADDSVMTGPESCGEDENVNIEFLFDGDLKGLESNCFWEE